MNAKLLTRNITARRFYMDTAKRAFLTCTTRTNVADIRLADGAMWEWVGYRFVTKEFAARLVALRA